MSVKEHYLDGPDDIDGGKITHLPDRSKLSGLYISPKVNCRSDGDVRLNEKHDFNKSSPKPDERVRKTYIWAGFLLPLPIFAAQLLYYYIYESVNINSALFVLPIIVVLLMLLVAFSVIIIKKVVGIVSQFGVSPSFYLVYVSLCLVAVWQPVILLTSDFGPSWAVSMLAFYSIITLISAVIGAVFILVINSNFKMRFIILALIPLLCLLVYGLLLN